MSTRDFGAIWRQQPKLLILSMPQNRHFGLMPLDGAMSVFGIPQCFLTLFSHFVRLGTDSEGSRIHADSARLPRYALGYQVIQQNFDSLPAHGEYSCQEIELFHPLFDFIKFQSNSSYHNEP